MEWSQMLEWNHPIFYNYGLNTKRQTERERAREPNRDGTE